MSDPPILQIELRDRQVLDVMARLLSVATDPRPLHDRIGADLEGNAAARFRDKRDPDGMPWTPWADSTAARRQKQGKGELLRFDGHLSTSLNYQPLSDGVAVGYAQKYAVHHEFGAPRANIPRRGLLMSDPEAGTIGEQDRVTVLEILENYVLGVAGG